MSIEPSNISEQPVLKLQVRPSDMNERGDAFGGWILNQIDIAGGIAATIATKGMTATKAIKNLVFIQPIFAYDVVSFYTEVLAVGTTSITIKVEALARRMVNPDELVKVSGAEMVFVAISKPGEKRVINK